MEWTPPTHGVSVPSSPDPREATRAAPRSIAPLHLPVLRRRPHESSALKTLRKQSRPLTVPPDELDHIASTTAEPSRGRGGASSQVPDVVRNAADGRGLRSFASFALLDSGASLPPPPARRTARCGSALRSVGSGATRRRGRRRVRVRWPRARGCAAPGRSDRPRQGWRRPIRTSSRPRWRAW